MNYHSFTDSTFKTNSILTLLHRCFSICSSRLLFDEQVFRLHDYYILNRFPSGLFWKTVRSFMRRIRTPRTPSFHVPRDIKYVSLPFYGHQSYSLRKKLQTLFRNYFPQINVRIVLSNRATIGAQFPVKERLPERLCSRVIYKFTCEDCSSSYVGSSIRTLHERTHEHLGKSFLTGAPLTNLKHSSIRVHSHNSNHPLKLENFTIIGRAQSTDHIRLLESVYIRHLNPDLNDMETAMPLHII